MKHSPILGSVGVLDGVGVCWEAGRVLPAGSSSPCVDAGVRANDVECGARPLASEAEAAVAL